MYNTVSFQEAEFQQIRSNSINLIKHDKKRKIHFKNCLKIITLEIPLSRKKKNPKDMLFSTESKKEFNRET